MSDHYKAFAAVKASFQYEGAEILPTKKGGKFAKLYLRGEDAEGKPDFKQTVILSFSDDVVKQIQDGIPQGSTILCDLRATDVIITSLDLVEMSL